MSQRETISKRPRPQSSLIEPQSDKKTKSKIIHSSSEDNASNEISSSNSSNLSISKTRNSKSQEKKKFQDDVRVDESQDDNIDRDNENYEDLEDINPVEENSN